MEQCFRIALWMFLLIGCLQAAPTINKVNLGLHLLKKDVQCGQNVTFSSPTNVQEHCYKAAMDTIKKGLEHFLQQCSDTPRKLIRIDQTLDALQRIKVPTPFPQPTNSSDCEWDKKPFEHFVDNIEGFIENLNSV